MTNEPFNIDRETLPDNLLLIRGKYLENTAKAYQIPFRKAVQDPVREEGKKFRTHSMPVGIVIERGRALEWERAVETAAAKLKARRGKNWKPNVR